MLLSEKLALNNSLIGRCQTRIKAARERLGQSLLSR